MVMLAVVPMFFAAAGCGPKKTEELPMVDVAPTTPETPVEPLPPPATDVTVKPVAPTAAAQTHTVQKGDTLYSLANRYYGDGKLWPKILEANRDKIKNEKTVPIGAVLKIPPK
jgi:nucleoid-associated protein YgaU